MQRLRLFVNQFRYGWAIYVLLALFLLKAIDQKKLALQTLGLFQLAARNVLDQYFEPAPIDPKILTQAIVYYKTLGQLFGSTPAENHTMGYSFYLLHDYKKATMYFKKAYEGAPERYAVLFNLGMSYYAQKQFSLANECFIKAMKLLTPEEYFRKDVLSPYQRIVMKDTPSVFMLVMWHCTQMIEFSQKGQKGQITDSEIAQEKQWRTNLLNNKLFYWIPVREVIVAGGVKSTL